MENVNVNAKTFSTPRKPALADYVVRLPRQERVGVEEK
jgi:hypothetical protein